MKTIIRGLILCLIVLLSSIVSDIVPDVQVIYSVGTERDYVDLQVRSGTNSIGKLFVLDNGTVLVPEASPQSIQNLQSLYKISNTTSKWTLNDEEWEKKVMSDGDENVLSLKIPDVMLCEYRNGGCQMGCVNTNTGPQCSCPTFFILNSDKRTCSTNASSTFVLQNNNGVIQSPNYPNNYPNQVLIKWVIVAPINHKIILKILSLRTELHYDHLRVEGKNLSIALHGTKSEESLTSESHMMWITFSSDSSNTYSGFSASYKTVPHAKPELHILQSKVPLANVELPLTIIPTNLCISVIYALGFYTKLEVFVQHEISRTILSLSQTYQEKEWTLSLFTLPTEFTETETPKALIVRCSGLCKIANIADCTDSEEIYSLGSRKWNGENVPQLATVTRENRENCSNNGFFNSSANVCLCLPGFTGNQCEETCGLNRFGKKCESVCSSFNKGCKGIIFCDSANCACASGFKGEACQEECIQGHTYGSMCLNECGKCIDGICDKFTGECIYGCIEGFYPPNCQYRYVTLKNSPSVVRISWFSILMAVEPKNVTGKGKPHLYSIQHKEKGSDFWLPSLPQAIENNLISITVNLTGLKAGINYTSRVILISEDGNSYQGPNVPEVEFCTQCEVPDLDNYVIKTKNVTASSFIIEWKNKTHNDKWCPVISYDVILQDSWRKFIRKISSRDILQAVYSDLWPGHQYTILICAWTDQGKVPCSSPLKIITLEGAPGKVKFLSVKSRNARDVHISWKRPLLSGGVIKGYKIQYQCLKHIGCNASCANSNGTIETTQMFTTLYGLLPYSQYKIKVAAYTTIQGPSMSIYAMTNSEIPDNAPLASENFLISGTNSSVTVQWKPPQCVGLNGNLQGYFFTLSKVFDNGTTSEITFSGSTNNTQITLVGLTPKTHYELSVHTLNSHGWNPHNKLQISLSTTATVPDAVTYLEVYKSGRRMLALRWGKPSKPYGELKSFTIVYHQVGGDTSFNETILPTPCLGWPDLYCHTINSNLLPDKRYSVSVMARNNEINEDGIASEITAQCRELAPDAPSYLRILKTDSTSFEMEWGVPRKFNGELRSFLVNVEHIDAANDAMCCEYFPVQELPFREENSHYSLAIDGLLPASTYITSVSAKTVILGPSVNVTFYTPPEPITTLISPQINQLSNGSYSVKVFKPSTTTHPRINSIFLLLVLHDTFNITSDIWYVGALDKLTESVNRKYYIASEIIFDEGDSEKNIIIGTGETVRNGTIGEIRDPVLIPGEYQVGIALLQSFGEAISISFKASNYFRTL